LPHLLLLLLSCSLYPQLMMYDDNRYELESKYTQFITLTSRPVWPLLLLLPLSLFFHS
jgi:hypothetical protein